MERHSQQITVDSSGDVPLYLVFCREGGKGLRRSIGGGLKNEAGSICDVIGYAMWLAIWSGSIKVP
jgi:hypothetical protein